MNCHGYNFLQPCAIAGIAQSRYKIMFFFPHMMVDGEGNKGFESMSNRFGIFKWNLNRIRKKMMI